MALRRTETRPHAVFRGKAVLSSATRRLRQASPLIQHSPYPEDGTLIFCIHCGAENPPSARFCHQCGGEVYSSIKRNSRRATDEIPSGTKGRAPGQASTENPTKSGAPRSQATSGQPAEPLIPPTIPSGSRVAISISQLPSTTKQRINEAVSNKSSDTIWLPQASGNRLPFVGIAIACAVPIAVIVYAQRYRWDSFERFVIFTLLTISFFLGVSALASLIVRVRSPLKSSILINPFYVIQVTSAHFYGYPLSSLLSPNLSNPTSDESMRLQMLYLAFKDGTVECRCTSPRERQQIVQALAGFKRYREELATLPDYGTIDRLDLLCDLRTGSGKSTKAPKKRFAFGNMAGLVVALIFAGVFTLIGDQLNNRADDNLRWTTASNTNTAAAYRVYLATRTDGRHSAEARHAINQLYNDAQLQYEQQAGAASTEAIDALVAILEYARNSGQYKIGVTFHGSDEIGDGIEDRLEREYGIRGVKPVRWSFQETLNQSREDKILQQIQSRFGKIIPGDILAFEKGVVGPDNVVFDVTYTVKPSGSVYYPVSQERLAVTRRDYYAGITYDWEFQIRIPQRRAPFRFGLKSEPASLFEFAYQRASSNLLNQLRHDQPGISRCFKSRVQLGARQNSVDRNRTISKRGDHGLLFLPRLSGSARRYVGRNECCRGLPGDELA